MSSVEAIEDDPGASKIPESTYRGVDEFVLEAINRCEVFCPSSKRDASVNGTCEWYPPQNHEACDRIRIEAKFSLLWGSATTIPTRSCTDFTFESGCRHVVNDHISVEYPPMWLNVRDGRGRRLKPAAAALILVAVMLIGLFVWRLTDASRDERNDPDGSEWVPADSTPLCLVSTPQPSAHISRHLGMFSEGWLGLYLPWRSALSCERNTCTL